MNGSQTISAGTFRSAGVAIPDDIPDDAVVPVSAVKSRLVQASPVDGSDVLASVLVEFTAPFDWSEPVDDMSPDSADQPG